MNLKPCVKCGFAFDVDLLGVPVCPNCHGKGLHGSGIPEYKRKEKRALTVAERQLKAAEKKRAAWFL